VDLPHKAPATPGHTKATPLCVLASGREAHVPPCSSAIRVHRLFRQHHHRLNSGHFFVLLLRYLTLAARARARHDIGTWRHHFPTLHSGGDTTAELPARCLLLLAKIRTGLLTFHSSVHDAILGPFVSSCTRLRCFACHSDIGARNYREMRQELGLPLRQMPRRSLNNVLVVLCDIVIQRCHVWRRRTASLLWHVHGYILVVGWERRL